MGRWGYDDTSLSSCMSPNALRGEIETPLVYASTELRGMPGLVHTPRRKS